MLVQAMDVDPLGLWEFAAIADEQGITQTMAGSRSRRTMASAALYVHADGR
jgi:hypothetical protein